MFALLHQFEQPLVDNANFDLKPVSRLDIMH